MAALGALPQDGHPAVRLCRLADPLREIVTAAQETCLSLQSQHMNVQMRRLTALTAVFMPLSLVAGIYGMNFTHMPELSLVWGYPAVLLVMAVACGFLYRNFRRNNWL